MTVTLRDGTSKPAKIVGTDPAIDVAVLKIDATGLPARDLDPRRRDSRGRAQPERSWNDEDCQ